MSEKTRAELKEQIKIMNHNYQVIREMHERGCQYSVSEIKRLQDDLERTRKALDVAKDAIDVISLKYHKDTPSIFLIKYAENAKAEITALEQKDVK